MNQEIKNEINEFKDTNSILALRLINDLQIAVKTLAKDVEELKRKIK